LLTNFVLFHLFIFLSSEIVTLCDAIRFMRRRRIYYTWSKTCLIEKRIYANPSFYPNSNPNTNTNPNSNPNPKAQLGFQTDEMTSFFDQM